MIVHYAKEAIIQRKIILCLQEKDLSPQTSSATLSVSNSSEATVVPQDNGAARRSVFVQPAGGKTRGADYLRQLFHSTQNNQSAQSLASMSQVGVGVGGSESTGVVGSAGGGATQHKTAGTAAVAASVQESSSVSRGTTRSQQSSAPSDGVYRYIFSETNSAQGDFY